MTSRDRRFWRDKRVLITGHTGFKGSWLAACLTRYGARVTGFALPPADHHSLFVASGLDEVIDHNEGNILDGAALVAVLNRAQPEIVFHLAAQPLVSAGYEDPAGTYATNLLGTVCLLDRLRGSRSLRAALMVTSDKCYQPQTHPLREDDRLGGVDPYSASKACAELAVDAFRQGYAADFDGAGLATVRAGNVIGPGDWAPERLLPDLARAVATRSKMVLRRPDAVRPWQHVLDAITGYLTLAEALAQAPRTHSGAWNFGPDTDQILTSRDVVALALKTMGPLELQEVAPAGPIETHSLLLDSAKARRRLGWRPRWSTTVAIERVARGYRSLIDGMPASLIMAQEIEAHALKPTTTRPHEEPADDFAIAS
ncbi:MAG: CDP-glucose 4,6-dehydratase [Geminicoccaceae bacterium]